MKLCTLINLYLSYTINDNVTKNKQVKNGYFNTLWIKYSKKFLLSLGLFGWLIPFVSMPKYINVSTSSSKRSMQSLIKLKRSPAVATSNTLRASSITY